MQWTSVRRLCLRTELRCKKRRLPDGAFIALAVAQDHHRSGVPAITLGGKSAAERDRQTVSQGTGGQLHTRHIAGHVARELCPVCAIAIEPARGEKAAFGKRGIEDRRCVTFAQNKAVSIRPIRVFAGYPQEAPVEYSQHIGNRKA